MIRIEHLVLPQVDSEFLAGVGSSLYKCWVI